MKYNQILDMKVSHLGMGNMRLPVLAGGGAINEPEAKKMLEYAYEQGINYFDVAYRYHGGASEPFVSSVLRQFPRDTWYLASKMPGHMMQYKNGRVEGIGYLANETISSPRQIFEDQLKRCGVDYFDVYLLHNLCETSLGFYTDEELGVIEYLKDRKKAGYIRHLGISSHGRAETIGRFLDAYDCFDVAQIQLNYMDWSLQDAKSKYEVLTERGIPIIAMEPCRGGRLASLGQDADSILKTRRPGDSVASWAFRFLQSLPNVAVVLSGMTAMEQLQENIGLFSAPNPTTDEETKLLESAVESIAGLIPCTGCRYCCEVCPMNLEIPKLMSMSDGVKYENSFVIRSDRDAMKEAELPSNCIACGACAQVCPQGIEIPSILKELSERLAAL